MLSGEDAMYDGMVCRQ